MNRPHPLWSRHSYPVQTPQISWPPSASTASQPINQHLNSIPTTIRACKNAETFRPKGRTLIVCLDGTGDKFDNDNSNIVHLVSCLKKDDRSQVTYYQSGIGTYSKSGGLSKGFSAAVDMAIGSGLPVHVKDAYQFLMETYREGDKICLFGFSRGAYTARCVAGMLHKVGLLPAHNRAQLPFAYQFYKDDTNNGWAMSRDFKRTFAIECSVYFVGVWDCVASVGFIPRKLPFSSTPTSRTGHFRHAMALDEHRAKFKVCHWTRKNTVKESEPVTQTTAAEPNPAAQSNGQVHVNGNSAVLPKRRSTLNSDKTKPTTALRANGHIHGNGDVHINGLVNGHTNGNGILSPKRSSTLSSEKTNGAMPKPSSASSISSHHHQSTFEEKTPRHIETDPEEELRGHEPIETDVLEVWFMGCHADVGGGAVPNSERHMLSRIPLRWMIRQCFECDTGILFHTERLAEKGLDVHTLWPVYTPVKRPVVGPSPATMEKYEAGELEPLEIRGTALSARQKSGGMHSPNLASAAAAPWVTEQHEDFFDALAPINDQLVQAKGWWTLEFWPIKVRIQHPDTNEWVKKLGINLGRGRAVQDLEPNLHWTVKERARELKGKAGEEYKEKVRLGRGAVWKVVT